MRSGCAAKEYKRVHHRTCRPHLSPFFTFMRNAVRSRIPPPPFRSFSSTSTTTTNYASFFRYDRTGVGGKKCTQELVSSTAKAKILMRRRRKAAAAGPSRTPQFHICSTQQRNYFTSSTSSRISTNSSTRFINKKETSSLPVRVTYPSHPYEFIPGGGEGMPEDFRQWKSAFPHSSSHDETVGLGLKEGEEESVSSPFAIFGVYKPVGVPYFSPQQEHRQSQALSYSPTQWSLQTGMGKGSEGRGNGGDDLPSLSLYRRGEGVEHRTLEEEGGGEEKRKWKALASLFSSSSAASAEGFSSSAHLREGGVGPSFSLFQLPAPTTLSHAHPSSSSSSLSPPFPPHEGKGVEEREEEESSIRRASNRSRKNDDQDHFPLPKFTRTPRDSGGEEEENEIKGGEGAPSTAPPPLLSPPPPPPPLHCFDAHDTSLFRRVLTIVPPPPSPPYSSSSTPVVVLPLPSPLLSHRHDPHGRPCTCSSSASALNRLTAQEKGVVLYSYSVEEACVIQEAAALGLTRSRYRVMCKVPPDVRDSLQRLWEREYPLPSSRKDSKNAKEDDDDKDHHVFSSNTFFGSPSTAPSVKLNPFLKRYVGGGSGGGRRRGSGPPPPSPSTWWNGQEESGVTSLSSYAAPVPSASPPPPPSSSSSSPDAPWFHWVLDENGQEGEGGLELPFSPSFSSVRYTPHPFLSGHFIDRCGLAGHHHGGGGNTSPSSSSIWGYLKRRGRIQCTLRNAAGTLTTTSGAGSPSSHRHMVRKEPGQESRMSKEVRIQNLFFSSPWRTSTPSTTSTSTSSSSGTQNKKSESSLLLPPTGTSSFSHPWIPEWEKLVVAPPSSSCSSHYNHNNHCHHHPHHHSSDYSSTGTSFSFSNGSCHISRRIFFHFRLLSLIGGKAFSSPSEEEENIREGNGSRQRDHSSPPPASRDSMFAVYEVEGDGTLASQEVAAVFAAEGFVVVNDLVHDLELANSMRYLRERIGQISPATREHIIEELWRRSWRDEQEGRTNKNSDIVTRCGGEAQVHPSTLSSSSPLQDNSLVSGERHGEKKRKVEDENNLDRAEEWESGDLHRGDDDEYPTFLETRREKGGRNGKKMKKSKNHNSSSTRMEKSLPELPPLPQPLLHWVERTATPEALIATALQSQSVECMDEWWRAIWRKENESENNDKRIQIEEIHENNDNNNCNTIHRRVHHHDFTSRWWTPYRLARALLWFVLEKEYEKEVRLAAATTVSVSSSSWMGNGSLVGRRKMEEEHLSYSSSSSSMMTRMQKSQPHPHLPHQLSPYTSPGGILDLPLKSAAEMMEQMLLLSLGMGIECTGVAFPDPQHMKNRKKLQWLREQKKEEMMRTSGGKAGSSRNARRSGKMGADEGDTQDNAVALTAGSRRGGGSATELLIYRCIQVPSTPFFGASPPATFSRFSILSSSSTHSPLPLYPPAPFCNDTDPFPSNATTRGSGGGNLSWTTALMNVMSDGEPSTIIEKGDKNGRKGEDEASAGRGGTPLCFLPPSSSSRSSFITRSSNNYNHNSCCCPSWMMWLCSRFLLASSSSPSSLAHHHNHTTTAAIITNGSSSTHSHKEAYLDPQPTTDSLLSLLRASASLSSLFFLPSPSSSSSPLSFLSFFSPPSQDLSNRVRQRHPLAAKERVEKETIFSNMAPNAFSTINSFCSESSPHRRRTSQGVSRETPPSRISLLLQNRELQDFCWRRVEEFPTSLVCPYCYYYSGSRSPSSSILFHSWHDCPRRKGRSGMDEMGKAEGPQVMPSPPSHLVSSSSSSLMKMKEKGEKMEKEAVVVVGDEEGGIVRMPTLAFTRRRPLLFSEEEQKKSARRAAAERARTPPMHRRVQRCVYCHGPHHVTRCPRLDERNQGNSNNDDDGEGRSRTTAKTKKWGGGMRRAGGGGGSILFADSFIDGLRK